MARPVRRLSLTLVLVLGLAACGGDDGGGQQGASSGACPDGAVVIEMVDIKFDPEDATAAAGDEVCWINEDDIQHNAVAEEGGEFKSDLFNKGQTFTTTVDEPATINYVCTVHPNMKGKVIVE